MKNIRMSVKLVGMGTLIMIVPLALVAVLAVTRSTSGLSSVENEQLAGRANLLAQVIDRTFKEELKLAQVNAQEGDYLTVCQQVAAKGAAKSGKAVDAATASLQRFMGAQGVGADYVVAFVAGADGIVIATSNVAYLGISIADEPYFKTALSGTPNTGAAARDMLTTNPFVPVAVPIKSETNGVVGVSVLFLGITFVNDLVKEEKIGTSGYAMVVDSAGLVVAHPKDENILRLNIGQVKGMETLSRNMMDQKKGVDEYTFQYVVSTAGYAPVPTTGWSVALTLPKIEYLATATDVRDLVLIVGAIAIILGFFVYWLFSRTITKPLVKGVVFAQLVASGDFSQRLDIGRKDEVGSLAEALNTMSAQLSAMVAKIKGSAEQVALSSQEISASAQSLADGSQSQASTLEETSASVEQLTASVDQVAEHARAQAEAVEQGTSSMAQVQKSIDEISHSMSEISGLAAQSVDKAVEGARAVSQVVEGINLISDSSEKIAGIVNVISEIADQTNLLALNASIEAARAGEHGRGFAVVADEVSKLADRSSRSTKEIGALIKESVKNVTRGVLTAKGSQEAMEEIRGASQKVKEMIEGLSSAMKRQLSAVTDLTKALENVNEMSRSISAATEEQTSNSKQVAKAVESVNELTQAAASAAEQMSSSTEQLSSMAKELQTMTEQFTIEGTKGPAEAAPIVEGESHGELPTTVDTQGA
jgi:methyl-accepting chemotaxis protein